MSDRWVLEWGGGAPTHAPSSALYEHNPFTRRCHKLAKSRSSPITFLTVFILLVLHNGGCRCRREVLLDEFIIQLLFLCQIFVQWLDIYQCTIIVFQSGGSITVCYDQIFCFQKSHTFDILRSTLQISILPQIVVHFNPPFFDSFTLFDELT